MPTIAAFFEDGALDSNGNPVASGLTAEDAAARRDALADAQTRWWLSIHPNEGPDFPGYGEPVQVDGPPAKFGVVTMDAPNAPPAQLFAVDGTPLEMGTVEPLADEWWPE